jgi:hypothetical protein
MAVTPGIDFRDITGSIVQTVAGNAVTLTTSPQRLIVTGTPNVAGAVLGTGSLTGPGTAVGGSHVFVTQAGYGLGTIPVGSKPGRGNPTGLLTTGQPAGMQWVKVRWRDDGEAMGAQVTTNYPPGRYNAQTEWFADYEYPPARASIAYSSLGNVIRSGYAYIVLYGTPPPLTLLRSVTNPMLQIAVNRRKGQQFVFNDDMQVFHPLGANAAPVAVWDWQSGEDAQQFIVVCSTGTQSQRLRAVSRAPDVMQVQHPQGGRTYVIITGQHRLDELLTSDVDTCDVDGQVQPYLKYEVHTLVYLETAAP